MCGPLVPLEDGPLVPLENHRLLPRPRGRGPPGCVWDMQVGGWLRAGGSKWVKVRNEKRKLEGAVKMAAWQELLAGKRAAREAEKEARVQQKLAQAAAKEQERLLKERNRQELERNRQEFEQELKKRRAAEQQAAREAVKLDGKTVYCTWHLSRCDVDGDGYGGVRCKKCDEHNRDVRHANALRTLDPDHNLFPNKPVARPRCVFFEDGGFKRWSFDEDGRKMSSYRGNATDKRHPLLRTAFTMFAV